MDTCVKCGAGLGVGRFCLNCGHPIGAPLPDTTVRTPRVPRERHAAAAEQARRLQAPERPVLAPVPDTPADRASHEHAWLLGEGEADDEPSRLSWVPWVLAAVAVLAAVFLLLGFIENRWGTDDAVDAVPSGETSTDGETEETGPKEKEGTKGGKGAAKTEEPALTGPVVALVSGATVTVPATAPPTTDLDGAVVPYDRERMLDGDPSTAWRMPGDGTGARITLTLPEPGQVTRVGLVNGYAKQVGGVDWYPNNRRILAVRWTFEDGTSVEQTLAEVPTVQWVKIDPVTSEKVTLTLLSVSPPGAGDLGRDYTAISTVAVMGRPAG